MLDNHLSTVLRYKSMLNSLSVDEVAASYFQNNPEAKEERKRELFELRDEIALASIRPMYKENMANKIDGYLEMLDPKNPNSDFDPSSLLPYLLTGLLFGYTVEVEKQRYIEKLVRHVGDEIITKYQSGELG